MGVLKKTASASAVILSSQANFPEIILGDGGTGHFIVTANESRGRPIDRGFDALSIAVVDEGGTDKALSD